MYMTTMYMTTMHAHVLWTKLLNFLMKTQYNKFGMASY